MSIKQRLMAMGVGGLLLTTASGVAVLEGEVRKPYGDVGGVSTVCFGSTQFITKEAYTAQECAELLLRDVKEHMQPVLRDAPKNAPHSVIAALTSVTYNVGIGGYNSSPMRPLFILGDYRKACEAIIAPWKGKHGVAKGYRATVNGKPHKGLENRRQLEYNECVHGL